MNTGHGSVDTMKLAQNNAELHNYRTKSITKKAKQFLKPVHAFYMITLCHRASKHFSCHGYNNNNNNNNNNNIYYYYYYY
jgi:hypothetical protein